MTSSRHKISLRFIELQFGHPPIRGHDKRGDQTRKCTCAQRKRLVRRFTASAWDRVLRWVRDRLVLNITRLNLVYFRFVDYSISLKMWYLERGPCLEARIGMRPSFYLRRSQQVNKWCISSSSSSYSGQFLVWGLRALITIKAIIVEVLDHNTDQLEHLWTPVTMCDQMWPYYREPLLPVRSLLLSSLTSTMTNVTNCGQVWPHVTSCALITIKAKHI